MATEIERKFLVSGDGWRAQLVSSATIRQGYLATTGQCSARVRIVDDKGYLTVKGPRHGMARPEFEYEIPLIDAQEMLGRFCAHSVIEKTRHTVSHQGVIWFVDVFHKPFVDFVIAEIELARVDEHFVMPDWIGEEVTTDTRFHNSSIANSAKVMSERTLADA